MGQDSNSVVIVIIIKKKTDKYSYLGFKKKKFYGYSLGLSLQYQCFRMISSFAIINIPIQIYESDSDLSTSTK